MVDRPGGPGSGTRDLEVLLDELERATDRITASLDSGDLDTAEETLALRFRLIDRLGVVLDGRGEDARPGDAGERRRVMERVRVLSDRTSELASALSRATERVLDEIRTLPARRRLVEMQSINGRQPSGGWCDIRR